MTTPKASHLGGLGGPRGFTLLEIMVAVAIMLILTGLSLGGYTFSQQKSRDAKRKSDLGQVARALQLFNEDFGRYPLGNTGGKIRGCGADLTQCLWGGEFSTTKQGTDQVYMTKLPEDPKSNLNYFYVSSGDGFELYAVLENDKDSDYRGDLTVNCGGVSSVNCSYKLTEYGVEVE